MSIMRCPGMGGLSGLAYLPRYGGHLPQAGFLHTRTECAGLPQRTLALKRSFVKTCYNALVIACFLSFVISRITAWRNRSCRYALSDGMGRLSGLPYLPGYGAHLPRTGFDISTGPPGLAQRTRAFKRSFVKTCYQAFVIVCFRSFVIPRITACRNPPHKQRFPCLFLLLHRVICQRRRERHLRWDGIGRSVFPDQKVAARYTYG